MTDHHFELIAWLTLFALCLSIECVAATVDFVFEVVRRVKREQRDA